MAGPLRNTKVRPERDARGPKVIGVVTVLLGILVLGARPAGAHEVSVTMVIAANDGSDMDPTAVVEGLRFAIDQSPDVGHAAGSDAGDHLGGVDIELAVLDNLDIATNLDEAAPIAVRGAKIVVVLGDRAALNAAAARVPPGSGFFLAVLAGPNQLDTPLAFPVLRRVETLDTQAAHGFAASFEAAFGRTPTDSVAVGFDIGQLLDVLLAETSDEMPDASSLEKVSAEVRARLTITSLDGVSPVSAITQPSNDRGDGYDPTFSLVVVGAGMAAAALIITVVRKQHRARTS